MSCVLPANTPVEPGSPYPLGATWDGRGVNFALFSANAERVELCLFDAKGKRETSRVNLLEQTDGVWHCYLPHARPGLLYGYRCYGPYEPKLGHRFNHHKLLVDPYAKMLVGSIKWTDAHYGYRRNSPKGDLSFDRRDSAQQMPKCKVVDPAFNWFDSRKPNVPWSETVIYETHLRGFTMRHEGIPKDMRGTFLGMSHHKIIEYLKALGITSVELLPVHHYVDDAFLADRGLRNYWGYMTLNFFSPELRYLATPHLADFKTMVMRLHDAGIEVLLDVVYNHTCEGNEMGPTLSYRGIDNHSYYRLLPDDKRYYINDTGCGNTLDITHPRVLQMVMDSLRYWAEEMQVDGFRFDLASILGRELHGFDQGCGFFDAVRQDPVLNRCKLIAEPWDLGPGGYQLGGFPPGWAEWNDRTRDVVRRFWRGDEGFLPELARCVHGSSDKFEGSGRRPQASINYVCSHDGFTLNDLVSYNQRHNHANGENNNDGHHNSYSLNHGQEGPSADDKIRGLRARQRRNMLATVFLSQGVPMLLAGDEIGRTQSGNNNAYCQDNEMTWHNWNLHSNEKREFLAFVQRLIKLRAAHPVLRRSYYMHSQVQSAVTGFHDIQWVNLAGGLMSEDCWQTENMRCLGVLYAGDVEPVSCGQAQSCSDESLLILFNANPQDLAFTLPKPLHCGGTWRCLLNTAEPRQVEGEPALPAGETFALPARSVVVFALTLAERAVPMAPVPKRRGSV